ncbi:hypothetical protein Hanom_Chr15g01346211 [Helianthus anomalus]
MLIISLYCRFHLVCRAWPGNTRNTDKSFDPSNLPAGRSEVFSPVIYHSGCNSMKFLDWYVKIGVVSAAIGGSMEYFMIKTGFLALIAERQKGTCTNRSLSRLLSGMCLMSKA